MDDVLKLDKLQQDAVIYREESKKFESELYPNGEMKSYYYCSTNYSGPQIKIATIDDEIITDKVKTLYGEKCNWCGNLYIVKALGNEEYIGKTLYIEYISRCPSLLDEEYTKIELDTLNTVINPPLWTPLPL